MKNGKYVQPGYNERGEEIPDPTPIEVPVDFRAPPSLVDEIKRYVRAELSARADAAGEETFEEADDFWVDDDEHLSSEYELTDMQEEFILHPERFARVKESDDGKRVGSDGGKGSSVVGDGTGGVKGGGGFGDKGVGEKDEAVESVERVGSGVSK